MNHPASCTAKSARNFSRREFLSASGLALASVALPGCATTSNRA